MRLATAWTRSGGRRACCVAASTLLILTGRPAHGQGTVPTLPAGAYDLSLTRPALPPVRYALSVPKDYRGQSVPLVLALHFGGDPRGAGRAMLDILIQPALGDLGAIVVAPDALTGAWNSGENERAVNALLDAVEVSYAIDRRRVVVTGFSMGGSGVWYWAGRYPERFSAAIPVAGRPMPSPGPWRVPVFAVHSVDDRVNPIGPTEARITELRRAGVNARLLVLDGVSHYETGRFVGGLRQAVAWVREIWNAR